MMAPIVEAPIQPRRSVITLNPQGGPPLDDQPVSFQQRAAEAPVSNIAQDKAEAQIRQGLIDESGFPSVLRKISSFSSGEDTEKEDKLKQGATAPQTLGSLENDCGQRNEVLLKAMLTATKLSNFEDDCDDEDVFKALQCFPRLTKQRVSIHPVQDEEDEEKATDAFVFNETCSTQTFNFFIKSQSVSTPKHLRKLQGVCLQEQELPAPRTLMSPPTPPTENENQLNMTPANTLFPSKQLSIIMELTETNTVSSGTKSTAETHDFDSESSKSNYTTKPSSLEQCPMLDPILEVSAAQKSREAGRQSPQVNRDVMKMTDEEAMPALMMSMKVFEDKTETVPKMLLTKLGSNPPPPTNDDDYATLFTTTPTKASQFLADKVNPYAVNESMTFSKLSEITLPKLESGEIVSKFVPAKEQVQQGWYEASLKKDGMNVDDCGMANDSITFSKLKGLTNPGGLMDKGKKQVEPAEQRQKVFGDGSFDDKSLLEAFKTSLGSIHLRNFNPSATKFETSDIKLEFKEPAMPNVPSENLTMSTMNLIDAKNSSISEIPFFPSTSQIQESSVHIKQEPFEAVSGGKIINLRNSSTSSQASLIPQTPQTYEASAHGERGLGDSICAGKSNSHHDSSSSVQERSILSRFAEISRRQSEKVDESLNIDSSLHASNIGHFQEEIPGSYVSTHSIPLLRLHITTPSLIAKLIEQFCKNDCLCFECLKSLTCNSATLQGYSTQ
ncbi:unnamed protein product [Hermetia illucens]|uniref:Uncharacterized protein n=1 Tax=Hermetia illucens TaxID=343691 RepID=A0A7R8UTD6_HERIL|nr:uncharacterized protein LOC119656255 [Hermetia illucens]CAD7086714.1 unnamed protein product [Hermetia illucens]